jgi:hypothetical protein
LLSHPIGPPAPCPESAPSWCRRLYGALVQRELLSELDALIVFRDLDVPRCHLMLDVFGVDVLVGRLAALPEPVDVAAGSNGCAMPSSGMTGCASGAGRSRPRAASSLNLAEISLACRTEAQIIERPSARCCPWRVAARLQQLGRVVRCGPCSRSLLPESSPQNKERPRAPP